MLLQRLLFLHLPGSVFLFNGLKQADLVTRSCLFYHTSFIIFAAGIC